MRMRTFKYSALFLWRSAKKMKNAKLFDVSVSLFKLTSHLKAGIQKIPHRSTYFHLSKFEFMCCIWNPSNYASYHNREGRVCMTFIRRKTNISSKSSKTLINKKLGVYVALSSVIIQICNDQVKMSE